MNGLLIFPAITPESWEWARVASGEERIVVLAGSMASPPVGAPVGSGISWVTIPEIYADCFAEAFAKLVAEYEIAAVMSPIPSVHAFLRRHLAAVESTVRLINEAPITRQVRCLAQAEALATSLLPVERMAAGDAEGLNSLELRAVLDTAMAIHGETGAAKLAAIAGIFTSAPQGDVVEIGTLMGRSAAALRLLARRFDIGPVLTVDPWARDSAVQLDSPEVVREDTVAQWDYELLARGFTARMYALGDSEFAHLRLPSIAAHEHYATSPAMHFPPFRPVEFNQAISVLHIDGNHDYAAVAEDWRRWGRHLLPGGWLILDDYIWAHGDGPRRVGDALLETEAARIQRHFVCDKALFIRFSEAVGAERT